MNPAAMMKLMNAKNKFTANHPKFAAFLKAVFSRGIEEGTVIEITVQRPGEAPITSNIKVSNTTDDIIITASTKDNIPMAVEIKGKKIKDKKGEKKWQSLALIWEQQTVWRASGRTEK